MNTFLFDISQFQRLTLLLFAKEEEETRRNAAMAAIASSSCEFQPLERTDEDELILRRSQLFDKLARYFPEHMTQPKISLVDLLPL